MTTANESLADDLAQSLKRFIIINPYSDGIRKNTHCTENATNGSHTRHIIVAAERTADAAHAQCTLCVHLIKSNSSCKILLRVDRIYVTINGYIRPRIWVPCRTFVRLCRFSRFTNVSCFSLKNNTFSMD